MKEVLVWILIAVNSPNAGWQVGPEYADIESCQRVQTIIKYDSLKCIQVKVLK